MESRDQIAEGRQSIRSPIHAGRYLLPILAPGVWLAYLALLGLLVGVIVAAALEPGDILQRWLAILTRTSYREALIRTHAVAAFSALVTLIAGVIFIFSWRLRASSGVGLLIRAPLLLHGFPAALAYLIVFGNAGWINRMLQQLFDLQQPPLPLAFTVQALLVFFIISGLPYLLAYTLQAVRGEMADLEDMARVLGCSPAEAFRRVTLPLLKPPLKAAVALVYILAAGSLSVPMLIGGSRDPLTPAVIYGLITPFYDVPMAAAVAVGFIVSLVPALLILDALVDLAIRSVASAEIGWRSHGKRTAGPRWPSLRAIRGTGAARVYQAFWVVLLSLLVLTPIYSSFVRDWGEGLIASSFTLQWYREIPEGFWDSMFFSLWLGLGSVVITLVVGIPLALAWRFGPVPGKQLLKTLILVPIAVPNFLWGLGLIVIAYRWYPPFGQSPAILLAGLAFLGLPFMLRVLMTALEDFDARYLEMASSLGASSWERSRRVLIPMLLPDIGAGAVLVFIHSFAESNLSVMVAPIRYPTAPLWLYEAAGTSGIGAASAFEVFLIAIPFIGLVVWEAWLRRRLPWSRTRTAVFG